MPLEKPGWKDDADGKEDSADKDKPADKKVRATERELFIDNLLVRIH